MEEQYGMAGVTRIPEKYKDQFKQKENTKSSLKTKSKDWIYFLNNSNY